MNEAQNKKVERNKPRDAQKRAAIIQAAKQAFKEKGVAGTSMDKLAEIAQVSKRTVYNHFATKEDLVMVLVSELWEEVMLSGSAVDTGFPLEDQLYQLICEKLATTCTSEHLDLARVAVGHFFYDSSAMARAMSSMEMEQTPLYQWIKHQRDSGVLQIDDLEEANRFLMYFLKGQSFWPQVMGMDSPINTQEQANLARIAVNLFLMRYPILDNN